jgi:hypothetical protein
MQWDHQSFTLLMSVPVPVSSQRRGKNEIKPSQTMFDDCKNNVRMYITNKKYVYYCRTGRYGSNDANCACETLLQEGRQEISTVRSHSELCGRRIY